MVSCLLRIEGINHRQEEQAIRAPRSINMLSMLDSLLRFPFKMSSGKSE